MKIYNEDMQLQELKGTRKMLFFIMILLILANLSQWCLIIFEKTETETATPAKIEEKAMIKTIFEEQYYAGVLEGKAEGQVEGRVETGRDMVSDVLRMKFEHVPKEVEKTIRTMSDLAALKSLLAQAVLSNTIEEFAEGLR